MTCGQGLTATGGVSLPSLVKFAFVHVVLLPFGGDDGCCGITRSPAREVSI